MSSVDTYLDRGPEPVSFCPLANSQTCPAPGSHASVYASYAVFFRACHSCMMLELGSAAVVCQSGLRMTILS